MFIHGERVHKHNGIYVKTCIFCKQPISKKNRAKEHVWPQWLLERLERKDSQFLGLHSGLPRGLNLKSIRQQSIASLLLGPICVECNTGWMSNLESQCIPIFDKLWKSYPYKINLDLNQQTALAHWSFKTACVINASSNYRRIIPREHNSRFFTDRKLPDNCCVDIALCKLKNLNWLQGGMALIRRTMSTEDLKKMAKTEPYIITLNVLGLVLRVTWSPFTDVQAAILSEQGISRIYPTVEYNIVVNSPVLNEDHWGIHGRIVFEKRIK